MDTQIEMADRLDAEAARRYNARFTAAAYSAATANMPTATANALIDDAMALCGSPHYKISRRRWSKRALEFLRLFI